MSSEAEEPGHEPQYEDVEMAFRSAAFPSDALSVKRLRTAFPENFDGPGLIGDGYANNDFFFPAGPEEPEHLLRLTQLICAERTVASGSFYREYDVRHPGRIQPISAGEVRAIARAKDRLESGYQFFRLADSPETARLLIQQVEEEGRQQAAHSQSKGR